MRQLAITCTDAEWFSLLCVLADPLAIERAGTILTPVGMSALVKTCEKLADAFKSNQVIIERHGNVIPFNR